MYILLRIRGGGILTRSLAPPSPPPSPGFITPAGSAQASGHASSIAIPTYSLYLASWGNRTPGYRLVVSDAERFLPVCNHFGFICQSNGSFLDATRINP